MRESDIEKILTAEVKKLGGKAYKFVSPGNNGVPDRIVIIPGVPLTFVELKADTGKLTALQELQIRTLRKLGQRVEVVKGLDGLIEFFEGIGCLDTASRIITKYNS